MSTRTGKALWYEAFRLLFFAGVCFLIIPFNRGNSNHQIAYAQETPTVCADENYAGVRHCTRGTVHIIEIDPTKVRFETVLPVGYSRDNRQNSSADPEECRDVNVPDFVISNKSTGPGCYLNGSYPSESVGEMAERYKRNGHPVAAAFNADFFDSAGFTHGPQGLTVKNGVRFDGPAYNDQGGDEVNDPSLSISEYGNVRIGLADASHLLDNGSQPGITDRDAYWNTVGGGPMLVENGGSVVLRECRISARSCPSTDRDPTKDPRGRTAVGQREDGWLIVVVIPEWAGVTLQELANLMLDLGAVEAINLDGGSSTQLWYDNNYLVPSNAGRAANVAEGLLVFSVPISTKDVDISLPMWYTFYTCDAGDIEVTLDGEHLFSTSSSTWPGGAATKFLLPGSYTLSFTYSNTSEGKTPSVSFQGYNPVPIACAGGEIVPDPPEGIEQKQICHEYICFFYNTSIATEVSAQTIPEPTEADVPFWELLPTYTKFHFEEYPVEWAYGGDWIPAIDIFPIEEFKAIQPDVADPISAVKTTLAQRPPLIAAVVAGGSEIEYVPPFLPPQNAGMVFASNLQYINFDGGAGIRFVTGLAQDVGPMTLDRIFYTFQGLSDDGKYYVSARFPVSIALSLRTPPSQDRPYTDSDLEEIWAYDKEVVAQLDNLAAGEFEPDLEILDQLIKSLTLKVSDVMSESNAVVNTSTLNVRSGPGVNYDHISVVHRTDELVVIGRVQDCTWLQIVTPTGVEGWVSAQYVTLASACNLIPEVSSQQLPFPTSPSAPESSSEWIAYVDVDWQDPDKAYEQLGDIWMTTPDGQVHEQLTIDGNNTHPVWSPDGTRLVYEHRVNQSSELHILDLESGNTLLLASDACCAGWSPEGHGLAIFSYADARFKSVQPDGTIIEELCCGDFLGSAPFLEPSGPMHWSTNGIIYIPASGGFQIYDTATQSFGITDFSAISSVGLSEEIQSLIDFGACPDGPIWSPDLRYMAITIDTAHCGGFAPGGYRLLILDSQENLLIQDIFGVGFPTWSQDGSKMAVEFYTTGDFPGLALEGVALMGIPDGAIGAVIVEGGVQPTWRPTESTVLTPEQAQQELEDIPYQPTEIKGVYQKETEDASEMLINVDEVDWVEIEYIYANGWIGIINIPRGTEPPPSGLFQGPDDVCGQILWATSCSEKSFYPVFRACETGRAYLWQPTNSSFVPDAHYRIHDPLFQEITSLCTKDYGDVPRQLTEWSEYEQIDSCAVCEAIPPSE